MANFELAKVWMPTGTLFTPQPRARLDCKHAFVPVARIIAQMLPAHHAHALTGTACGHAFLCRSAGCYGCLGGCARVQRPSMRARGCSLDTRARCVTAHSNCVRSHCFDQAWLLGRTMKHISFAKPCGIHCLKSQRLDCLRVRAFVAERCPHSDSQGRRKQLKVDPGLHRALGPSAAHHVVLLRRRLREVGQ